MDSLLNAFVVLFVVVDPIGVTPMFATLTRSLERRAQRKVALKGTLLATAILLIFFLVGDALLARLGIGLPAFRIAGGVLLFLVAVDMVFARQSGLRSTTAREQEQARRSQDVTVFPLAFPLIAGPGALTTVLLMSSGSQGTAVFLGMIVIILAVLALTLLALLSAPLIMRILGETGANVFDRLFGLILAALAAQFVIDGIRASFPG